MLREKKYRQNIEDVPGSGDGRFCAGHALALWRRRWQRKHSISRSGAYLKAVKRAAIFSLYFQGELKEHLEQMEQKRDHNKLGRENLQQAGFPSSVIDTCSTLNRDGCKYREQKTFR